MRLETTSHFQRSHVETSKSLVGTINVTWDRVEAFRPRMLNCLVALERFCFLIWVSALMVSSQMDRLLLTPQAWKTSSDGVASPHNVKLSYVTVADKCRSVTGAGGRAPRYTPLASCRTTSAMNTAIISPITPPHTPVLTPDPGKSKVCSFSTRWIPKVA